MTNCVALFSLILMCFVVSCASSPSRRGYDASRVIERIGGKTETPVWASGEKALVEENSQVQFVNTISMSGDARPEACVRAAEETGRAQMMRYIKDALTSAGQVSELSSTDDPAVESLTAFLAQGRISGASIAGRYWEKREESDASGERVLRLHCAAKVAVSKTVLEKQLRDSISGTQGNPEIRKKLLDAQKTFIDGLAQGDADAVSGRLPAQEQD